METGTTIARDEADRVGGRATQLLVATPPLTDALLAQIRGVSPDVEVTYAPGLGAAELGARLAAQPEIEIVFSTMLPEWCGPTWALRWVQLGSAGVDQEVAGAVWRDSEVTVTTSSGIHAAIMSQWATAMILYHAHRLGEVLRFRETRRWPDRPALSGSVLIGKTLGLLGYGSVGRECARLGRALGMRVLALRRSAVDEPPGGGRFVSRLMAERAAFDGRVEVLRADGLDRLLAESDYLVVTAPLTPETSGLLDGRALGLMKPSAFIVNVSRGAIIDESALAGTLRSGRLAGAALDVFATEPPPPDSELFDLPTAVLSPHMSGVFDAYWDLAVEAFCDNLSRYLSGQPLLNVANRVRGY